MSGSLPILSLSCSLLSVVYVILVLNSISWCFILQLHGHLVNYIIPFFQLTSGLYLANQSYLRNMSVPFESVTAASSYFLCLLISISKCATLVTSPFFVPSTLKTLNEKFIGFVCIHLSLTGCLSIPICVHSESTNTLTLRFLPFFVFTFAHTFNSLSILLCQFGITYLFWEFTGKILSRHGTRNLLQNLVSCLYHLHYLIPPESFISSLTVSLYNLWQYAPLCHIWITF